MIKAANITISYAKQLFRDINFVLGNYEKVGLVGLNGCGKSTLLRIIMGLEKPDSGTIELSKNELIQYLPQQFSFPANTLVGEFLESLVNYDIGQRHRVDKVLSDLDFRDVDEFTEINTLSPGQKMKLYLAKLLIVEPTILLLDEPTNHLDIKGIIWFEQFISRFKGICIIISHDRQFLNNTVDHIFEIDEQKLYVYQGNYDDYLIQKEEFKQQRGALFKAQERKRAQLDQLIVNARKISDGKKRGRAIRAAEKRMEREVIRQEINQYNEQNIRNLNLEGKVHRSKRILEVKDLSFTYPQKSEPTIQDSGLEIYGNERLWLWGSNGIGKSTFVKLLIGQLKAQAGSVKWGDNLRWVYFAQDEANVPLAERVQDYFVRATGVDFGKSYGILGNFLFDKEMLKMRIEDLSPGQKSRLAFAVFAQQEYDCMILDEPTNHLDIKTKEIIEESLRNYQGTIILVSHDRYFSENLNPTRLLTIESSRLIELK